MYIYIYIVYRNIIYTLDKLGDPAPRGDLGVSIVRLL